MSGREWKPGDIALVEFATGWEPALRVASGGWVTASYAVPVSGYSGMRPLVVIDPEDMVSVAHLAKVMMAHGCRAEVDLQSALHEFANPKPRLWREAAVPVAPWPQVAECHSSRVPGHECPQCAWEHEHDWVAWTTAPTGPGVPIRCTKCGGRKCDAPDCALRRHSHTHAESGEAS